MEIKRSFEILMFPEYEQKLIDIAKQEQLICLRDYGLIQFDGRNALEFLSLISETRYEINTHGNIDLLTYDLVDSISPDIKFSLTNVYLYFPKANNFLKEIKKIAGIDVPTYDQTLEDKRFFFYINTTFEKLYNFWDRVGDVLAMAFNLEIRKKDIYFSSVIDKLVNSGIQSEYLQWLCSFRDGDYTNFLNRLRINIVHYRQKDSYFFMEWVNSFVGDNRNQPELLVNLQKEKEALPKLLKEQLYKTNEGFEKMIRLIASHGYYEKRD